MRAKMQCAVRVAMAFAGALLFQLALYRRALGRAVGNEGLRDVQDLLGEPFSPRNPLFHLVDDLPAWAIAVAALFLLAVLSLPLGRWAAAPPLAVGSAVLVAFAATAVTQIRFLVELNSPIDLGVLDEMRSVAWSDLADFVTAGDLALLAIGPPTMLLLYLPRGRWGHVVRATPLLVGVLAAAWLHRGAAELEQPVVEEFRRHPATRLVALALRARDEGIDRLPPFSAEQLESIALTDPALVVEPGDDVETGISTLAGAPRLPEDARPSVLVYILEGVRFDWALADDLSYTSLDWALGDDKPEHPPMPTLRRLASEGWALRRHFTSSNSSARANFSIFTGLYPPNESLFVTSKSVQTPILPTLAGYDDVFLRSPANLHGYYPLALLLNNGVTDARFFEQLPQTPDRPRAAAAISEFDGIDAAVERISATRGRRFFGVYVTWAPHQPYIDFDPENRFIPRRKPFTKQKRYLNTLNVVDRGLERILVALAEAGHRDDTVVIVVSDHGEAFGEHRKHGHKRTVIQQVMHVPVVIWAPRWIAPRIEERITSHVDLTPTLLDLLGIRFDPEAFQGESLLAPHLRRRFTFAHGSEGSFVSWDRARYKTIWQPADGSCVAYDLLGRGGENSRLSCDDRPEIRTTMQRFWFFQQAQLMRLNRLVASHWSTGAKRALSLRALESMPAAGGS